MRKSDSFYLPQLDGLRCFAFLGVFVWHFMAGWVVEFTSSPEHCALSKIAAKSLFIGANGVDLFFTLSAYLITELLMRERRSHGTIDIKSFCVRRALRIWPLYFGALTLTLLLSGLIPGLTEAHRYLPWYFLFIGNFALCRWGVPDLPISPLWSVSVEEQFYLIWPLTMRRLSRPQITLLAIAMWTIGILFRQFMRGAPQYAIAFNTLSRLDPIAAGILLAAVLNGDARIKSRLRPSTIAIAGAILWIIGFLDGFGTFAETLVALGSAAFLVAAIKGERGGFLSSRPLVWLGRISYGLYVFHAAVMMIGGAIFGSLTVMPQWCLMTVDLIATIAIAAASYRWIETPFLRLKRHFQRISSGASFDEKGDNNTIVIFPSLGEKPDRLYL